MKKRYTLQVPSLFGALKKLRPVSAFLSDRKGSTAVEFGLIGAVLETGMVYFQSAQLQMTTEYASRNLLVGTLPAGTTYQQFINQYVCTWQTSGTVSPYTLSKMFDCSKLVANITVPNSWAAANTANNFYTTAPPSGTAITQPASGQIGVVQIGYPVPAFIAILTGGVFTGQSPGKITAGQSTVGGNSVYLIMGIYAFMAE
jgi:Flp pilus assembly protein TadG